MGAADRRAMHMAAAYCCDSIRRRTSTLVKGLVITKQNFIRRGIHGGSGEECLHSREAYEVRCHQTGIDCRLVRSQ